MFQEDIDIVSIKNNSSQHYPSLPPSTRSQSPKQRLRLRQDASSSSSSSDDGAGSVTSIDPTSLATLPISISTVGVSTPPPIDNTESDTSSTSTSDSLTDTSSASSSDSSLPSSSESSSTSSSESSSSTSPPPSTTTRPPHTRPHTLPHEPSSPPMSNQTSSSTSPTVTDTTPSSPTSSSTSTSTMSSSSLTPPPTTSSSSSGTQETTSSTSSTSSTSTSTTPTSTSVSQTSSSSSTSISTSTSQGRVGEISPTSTTTSTPPPTSDTSSSTDGGSSSTSTSTGPDRAGGSTAGSPSPPTTTNGSGNPVTSVPMQSDGSPTGTPMTTLSTAVTLTTTDASGSTHLTVPPEFTTVIITTLPGGTFTTFTVVVANPPGVLNPGDVNRDSVAAFFQNKGAVAGVFIAASLAIFAIVLFVIFALRRRRHRFQSERDAEIAAGLAAAAANQRFADDEDHPVVMRNVPAAMRGRSPWLDDDDDDRLVYNTVTGPVMYSNLNGVGPPTQNMPIISEVAYPATAAHYIHARTNSRSPSPKGDSTSLPITSFEPVSPTGNSGRSLHGGAAHLGRESSSTNSASASANHGTVTHAPSSNGGHRAPASAGRDGSGNGTGSGSGGTSQPSLMTATPGQRGASSSRLEDMYLPEYQQYSRPNSSAVMGYAYEPDPVSHEHQITTNLRAVHDPYDGIRSPLSANIAASVGSTSVYSHEGEGSEEGDVMPHQDSRLDPGMRRTGGLADHEDYTRRVVPQQLMSPSTASNSHSMSHSHSTH